MALETKTAQLVTKLIRETAKGGVKWTVKDPPRSLHEATERVVPIYLEAIYKGKAIGVYEIRYKSYFDEDAFYWTETVGLCLVDGSGRVVWESGEHLPSLLDLLSTAREQASGIEDILDDLLD